MMVFPFREMTKKETMPKPVPSRFTAAPLWASTAARLR